MDLFPAKSGVRSPWVLASGGYVISRVGRTARTSPGCRRERDFRPCSACARPATVSAWARSSIPAGPRRGYSIAPGGKF